MNKQEIILRLETDYKFYIKFVVENNLKDVLAQLSTLGYKPSPIASREDSIDYAYNVLVTLVKVGNGKAVNKLISLIPYVVNVSGYTAGFEDYFSKYKQVKR